MSKDPLLDCALLDFRTSSAFVFCKDWSNFHIDFERKKP